jgi:hypothetical protein
MQQREHAAAVLMQMEPAPDDMKTAAQAAAKRIAQISKAMVETTTPSRTRKLRPSSRKQAARFAHWNMARLTKSQIQMLDELDYDVVGLSECWDTAARLQDYGGTNRMLVAGKPPKHDPAGSVAMRLSPYYADALKTWGLVPGAGKWAIYAQQCTHTTHTIPHTGEGGRIDTRALGTSGCNRVITTQVKICSR